jgi:hypothetical protein
MGIAMGDRGIQVRAHERKRSPTEGAEELGWQDAMARQPRKSNPYATTKRRSNFALACYRAWNRGWDTAYEELQVMNTHLPQKD